MSVFPRSLMVRADIRPAQWLEEVQIQNLHVVGEGHLALLVANDGEGNLGAGNLIDVLDPALVAVDGVGGETDELDATLGELGLELSEGAELGGADGGVVLGVREEDDPVVANELVEVDGTLGGLSIEVGGNAAEAETVRSSLVSKLPWLVRASHAEQQDTRPCHETGSGSLSA